VVRETLLQPMQVPGGWKTATLPEGSQSVYPIARTPLFPSGAISPRGAVAPYVKPVVDDDKTGDDKTGDDKTGEDVLGIGKKLAQYAGRAAVKGGISTSGTNLMYRVSGEPEEISVNPSGRPAYRTWGNLPIDVWSGGDVYKTTAYRPQTGTDWTDANNLWSVERTGDAGNFTTPDFNIKFADWAGGVSSNKIYGGTPTLDFLGNPQNVKMRDPDNPAGPMLNVPYALGQLAGMKTPGFDRATALGGKWIMPGIYGQERDTGMTTENLLGYGLPQWASDEFFASDWQSKGDLADALLEFHKDKGD